MSQNGRYFVRGDSEYNPHSREGKKNKFYEVFFRYIFTSIHPHGCAADAPTAAIASISVNKLSHITHDKEASAIASISVNKLSHITHDKEASAIVASKKGHFYFTTTQKMGKAYNWDGSPIGESFQDDFLTPSSSDVDMPSLDLPNKKYKYIKDTASLMPRGYYSWWGISVQGQDDLWHELWSPPPYLDSPPKSPYGNREFSGDFCKLLQCYQTSYQDESKPDVYLLRGGTLRYAHEICYIVIVCTEAHRKAEALKEYPPLGKQSSKDSVLNLCGLTDETGRVLDYSGKYLPIFSPKHLSANESWENLAFAFHFNTAKTGLSCSKDDLTESNINHDYCVKKQPPEPFAKWICPNIKTIVA